MLDKIYKIIDDNFDDEVKYLQKTLSFNTVLDKSKINTQHPFGENLTLSLNDFLADAKENGFTDTKNIDNMVGYAEIGDKKGRLIGILCHLDTVPFNKIDEWIAEPTSGKIIDSKIYGRGTTDDKGPTVACYYALLALMKSGVKLNNRFRLILGLDEESGFGCVKRYLKTEDVPVFSFSPDAKFPAVYGEKGIYQFSIKRQFHAIGKEPIILLGITAGERHNIVPDTATCYFGGKDIAKMFIEIEERFKDDDVSVEYFEDMLRVIVKGKAVHAMHPEKGINAIQRLFKILADVNVDYAPSELKFWIKDMNKLLKMESDGSSLGIAMKDDISGKLTLNFGAIRYDGKEMFARFDIRYPITLNPEYVDNEVVEATKRMMVTMRVDDHKIPLHIDKNSDDVKKLLTAYQDITGDMSEPITIGGGTYARAFPNALSFGGDLPDDEQLAHQTNEYISLDKLKITTKIYANALYRLNEA